MHPARILLIPAALLGAVGCGAGDPLRDYTFIVQWLGDKEYEEGTAVCGVARAREYVIALPHDTNLTCRPAEYVGSTQVLPAYSTPPAWLEELPWDTTQEPLQAPVTKVRAWGEWSVGLAPTFGVVVDRFDAPMHLERFAQVPIPSTAPRADLEVAGPFAYVADGASDLVVVSLEDLPDTGAVARLPLGGAVKDVYVDGTLAAVQVDLDLVLVDVTDPLLPVERGRVSFAGDEGRLDGVGLSGDFAYVAADGTLFTVDVSDPDAPVLRADAAVESQIAPITLIHGRYLFQAAGFDVPLAVTDLADPANPEPYWAFMGGNGVFDVAAAGHTLYLAVGSGGVHVWGLKRDYADAFEQ